MILQLHDIEYLLMRSSLEKYNEGLISDLVFI